MRTVILAAGEGSRMLPLSMYMEKSMLYVGGKPVVRRIVENVRNVFPKSPIELVVLDKYRKDFEHEFRDISSHFSIVSVSSPKGTVSAYLDSIAARVPGDDSEIMIHYADTVTDLNYYNLHLAFNDSSEAIDCILAVSKNIHHEYSQVNFSELDKKVYGFHEKPKLPKYSWTGIAIFDWNSMKEAIGVDVQADFGTHIFPRMLTLKQNVIAYPFDGRYDDVGNILSYWRLQRENIVEDKVKEDKVPT